MSIRDQIGSPGILQGRLSDCIARRIAVDESRRTSILNLSLFHRSKRYSPRYCWWWNAMANPQR